MSDKYRIEELAAMVIGLQDTIDNLKEALQCREQSLQNADIIISALRNSNEERKRMIEDSLAIIDSYKQMVASLKRST